MDNIIHRIEGSTLILEIDLEQVTGLTNNGKRARIAASHNVTLPVRGKLYHLGLNVSRSLTSMELQALTNGLLPDGWKPQI